MNPDGLLRYTFPKGFFLVACDYFSSFFWGGGGLSRLVLLLHCIGKGFLKLSRHHIHFDHYVLLSSLFMFL